MKTNSDDDTGGKDKSTVGYHEIAKEDFDALATATTTTIYA